MAAQAKKACLIILLILVCALAGVTLTDLISKEQKKTPSKVNLPVTKATAAKNSKAEFLRWQNDPKIDYIERAARKVLGWEIYGAVNCGSITAWEEQLPLFLSTDDQRIIKRAIDLYKKQNPFLYFVETLTYAEGMVENPVSTKSYQVIVGTRSGEVYEFWRHGASYSSDLTVKHRKWEKPTIHRKDRNILFFDASQTTKK